jgi:hypothetical protein
MIIIFLEAKNLITHISNGTNLSYRQTKPELVGMIKFVPCTQIINNKKLLYSQKLSEYQVSPESYNRTTYKRSLENAPILVKE